MAVYREPEYCRHCGKVLEERHRKIKDFVGNTFIGYKLCECRKTVNQRFKMPTDKQIIDMAIIFNDGRVNRKKLSDMVSMCQFVIDRLYENGDIALPSSKEH